MAHFQQRSRFSDLDAQLFNKFTVEALLRHFRRMLLTPGKFPLASMRFPLRALSNKYPSIFADQRTRHHMEFCNHGASCALRRQRRGDHLSGLQR